MRFLQCVLVYDIFALRSPMNVSLMLLEASPPRRDFHGQPLLLPCPPMFYFRAFFHEIDCLARV